MLFDLQHILFMVFSTITIVAMLICCYFFVKKDKGKSMVLQIAAVLTVIIHYSSLYVDFFSTGSAEISDNMLLPIYPCNVAMWLLLIVAFYKNKQSKVFSVLAEFTFYLGVVGGIIGIMFNEIYANNPHLADWDTLKGLLSHSVMLFGCLYLLVGGFIKIRVKNVLSVLYGLIGLILLGWIVIGIYSLAGLDPPNTMYLLARPFDDYPWINTATIGIAGLLVVFTISAIYEQIALPKEDRWYSLMRAYRKRNEDNRRNKK